MKKVTLQHLHALKKQKEKFAVLTAYDATFAELIESQGVEVILVGDSLGMVIQGQESTVPVSMRDMNYHVQCVRRGLKNTLLIADMPYMSYATPEQSYQNAASLMQHGANAVKLEGGAWLNKTIKGLSDRGIPVCGHLGLTPQSVDALSGYKVQGRSTEAAKQLMDDAQSLQSSGASMLVLECVPAELAKQVSESLTIPTIGIGAGRECDAQVLVLHDMLGLNQAFKPKFVKNFMSGANGDIGEAIKQYVDDVKSGRFPADEHCFE